MTYHDETEAETRTNRILPALQASGWGLVAGSRLREELICPGRIQSGGTRGKSLKCDYVLEYRGHKLAVLEAKKAGINYRDGTGQAKGLCPAPSVPFCIFLQWAGLVYHRHGKWGGG